MANSKWSYWRFYTRYGEAVVLNSEKFEEATIYNGQTSASGAHPDTLNGNTAVFTAFTESIVGGGGFKPIITKELYTGLSSTGGTFTEVVTGVSSSVATAYTLLLQGGNAK